MNHLLLHGPAKAASRRNLGGLKRKFDQNNILVFEEGTDLKSIKEALFAQSLFAENQLIILENPPEDLKFDAGSIDEATALILWFDHEIDPKKWPGFEAAFFPEAKEISVFPFLDLLAAKDPKVYLEMDKLKKANFDMYYLLTMVFYLLRSLAVISKKAPDFVRKKLERQRTKFPLEEVKLLYKQMLEIDFKIKSGLMEKEQAEFLMVQQFLR